MRILDLFAGLGGEQRRSRIEARGHELVTLDFDPSFGCTITTDIFETTAEQLGAFDFIWASPPCEAFSVASIGHHWTGGSKAYLPKTEEAKISQALVARTVQLINAISPPPWMAYRKSARCPQKTPLRCRVKAAHGHILPLRRYQDEAHGSLGASFELESPPDVLQQSSGSRIRSTWRKNWHSRHCRCSQSRRSSLATLGGYSLGN